MSGCAIESREGDRVWSETVLRTLLDEFPHVQLRVTGDCMRPELLPGDTVRLVSASRRRPRLGEVVLVRLPVGLRLHRLVWGWPGVGRVRRTKADRSAYWDPAFDSADLWGAVVAVERGGLALAGARRLGPALRSVGGALLRRTLGARAVVLRRAEGEPR